eukprot:gene9017-12190_t
MVVKLVSFIPKPLLLTQKQQTVLIHGNYSKCGKTSLAFRIAYDCAADGGHPLFICNQVKIEGSLPLLVSDSVTDNTNSCNFFSYTSNWNNEILSKIQMKYISNSKELMLMMAGIHMLSPLPTAIIIDDFSLILDPFMSTPRDDPRFIDQVLINLAYVDDALHYIQHRIDNRLRSQQ